MTRTAKMRPAFVRLHAVTLTPSSTPADLAAALTAAEAVTERHRLSEGAVYATACRRYLLDTGTEWHTRTVTAATTTWAESSHRYRLRDGVAACSCGARETVTTETAGETWHTAHLAAVA